MDLFALEELVIVLAASHRDIDRAFRYLTVGETDDPDAQGGGA
ncbi:MAG: hypothetical protein NT006_06785 [Candidatus Aminicenantes bacterium]|nr:hypothetical protein [Candidatus Aminicenantes bacterium]